MPGGMFVIELAASICRESKKLGAVRQNFGGGLGGVLGLVILTTNPYIQG